VFCLLVVLVKLSVFAKWLARKTPLRKPNCDEGIVSRKPRPKSVHDFLGSLYCFIVLLCVCVVSCPYMIHYPTVMPRYSLFVLKVSLNPKQTNKQCLSWKRTWANPLCVRAWNQSYNMPIIDRWPDFFEPGSCPCPCKSSNHITSKANTFRDCYCKILLQTGCPSCHPTNNVKELTGFWT